jgi:hypothetical protein
VNLGLVATNQKVGKTFRRVGNAKTRPRLVMVSFGFFIVLFIAFVLAPNPTQAGNRFNYCGIDWKPDTLFVGIPSNGVFNGADEAFGLKVFGWNTPRFLSELAVSQHRSKSGPSQELGHTSGCWASKTDGFVRKIWSIVA